MKLAKIFRTTKELPEKRTKLYLVAFGIAFTIIAEPKEQYIETRKIKRRIEREGRIKQLWKMYDETRELLTLAFSTSEEEINELLLFAMACVSDDSLTSEKWKRRIAGFAELTSKTYDQLLRRYPELIQTREDIRLATSNILDTRERIHFAIRHALMQFELIKRARKAGQLLTTAFMHTIRKKEQPVLYKTKRERRVEERRKAGRGFRKLYVFHTGKKRLTRTGKNIERRVGKTLFSRSAKANFSRTRGVRRLNAKSSILFMLRL